MLNYCCCQVFYLCIYWSLLFMYDWITRLSGNQKDKNLIGFFSLWIGSDRYTHKHITAADTRWNCYYSIPDSIQAIFTYARESSSAHIHNKKTERRERKSFEKKRNITDLYRILFNGGHQVDDGSSNNDLSIKWKEIKRKKRS